MYYLYVAHKRTAILHVSSFTLWSRAFVAQESTRATAAADAAERDRVLIAEAVGARAALDTKLHALYRQACDLTEISPRSRRDLAYR